MYIKICRYACIYDFMIYEYFHLQNLQLSLQLMMIYNLADEIPETLTY